MKKIEWYHSLIVFFLFILASQTIGSVLIIAYFFFTDGTMPSITKLMQAEGITAQATVMLIFFVVIPITYLKLLRIKPSSFYRFKKPLNTDIFWSILGIISLGILLSAFIHWLTELFPFIDNGLLSFSGSSNFHEIIANMFKSDHILKVTALILLIGVFPGFGEEFLFRGFMQRLLHQRFGFFVAVLLSGGLFGFIHAFQQISQAIAAFFISFYLGYIYYKSKKLLSPMIAHAINNSSFGLMVFLFPNKSLDTLPPTAIIILAIPLAIYSIYYFSLKSEKEWG